MEKYKITVTNLETGEETQKHSADHFFMVLVGSPEVTPEGYRTPVQEVFHAQSMDVLDAIYARNILANMAKKINRDVVELLAHMPHGNYRNTALAKLFDGVMPNDETVQKAMAEVVQRITAGE